MEKLSFDPAHTWLTADTHFGHGNIIRYCRRPFATVEEHDKAIMENLFRCCTEKDVLIHLGDVCFGSDRDVRRILAWLAKLPCRKLFIPGNHDRRNLREIAGVFSPLPDLCEIAVEGRGLRVVLCHYPLEEWDGAFRGALHFHGHVHGRRPSNRRREDVGVDAQCFTPVLLAELVSRLEKRKPMEGQDG